MQTPAAVRTSPQLPNYCMHEDTHLLDHERRVRNELVDRFLREETEMADMMVRRRRTRTHTNRHVPTRVFLSDRLIHRRGRPRLLLSVELSCLGTDRRGVRPPRLRVCEPLSYAAPLASVHSEIPAALARCWPTGGLRDTR